MKELKVTEENYRAESEALYYEALYEALYLLCTWWNSSKNSVKFQQIKPLFFVGFILYSTLTHFVPTFFLIPYEKIIGFLTFSGVSRKKLAKKRVKLEQNEISHSNEQACWGFSILSFFLY